MKVFNKETFNSFWFFFVSSLLINQLVLLLAVYVFLLKPNGDTLARVFIVFSDAVHQIYETSGSEGIKRLEDQSGRLLELRFDSNFPKDQNLPAYPAVGYVQQSIESITQGRISLTFSFEPKLRVWFTDNARPDFPLRLTLGFTPFAQIFLILSVILIGLVSTMAALWIRNRLTSPLKELSDQGKQLASGGTLRSIAVNDRSSSEIKELANTLNRMRKTLDQTASEREELLAMVTHDLRTPLSRLNVALEVADGIDVAQAKEMFDDIAEMRTLLEQYVELSKLNQEADQTWEESDLNDIVRSVQAKYARAGLEVNVAYDTAPALIRHKPSAILRLLYNLFDNALRHGSGDVKVNIARLAGNRVELRVMNPGVHEQGSPLLPKIPDHHQSLQVNSGLGLKIIRKFAQVHAAELSQSSEGGWHIYTLTFDCVGRRTTLPSV